MHIHSAIKAAIDKFKSESAVKYQYYAKMGEYLGYPKCCIDEFINDNKDGRFAAHYRKQNGELPIEIQGVGFIPCRKHTKMIVEGKIKIQNLINNRKCPVAFPDA